MKIETNSNVSNLPSGKYLKSFEIKKSAKLFKILSDGIYSDKISAVVRELSTNAVDSHIAAGNESYFDVYAPTYNSPYFIIRDYGVGLSPEAVEKVYTVYGESDKENSNDFIGCLGLGSKTPFCYNTRSAKITSYYNGKEYSYVAKLESDGYPKISLISEKSTNEHNGVKIEVEVDPSDFSNFYTTINNIYTYFRIKPKVHNADVNFHTVTYSYKNQHGGVRENSNYYDRVKAVMGNIAYQVDIRNDKVSDDAKRLLRDCHCDLFFDIGDLDIETSRERLSYDETTITNLVNKVNAFIEQFNQDLKQEIVNCKNLYEAKCVLKERLSYDIPVIDKKLMFNGVDVVNWTFGKLGSPVSVFRKYSHSGRLSKHDTYHFMDYPCKFLANDLKTAYMPRIRNYSNTVTGVPLVLLNDTSKTTLDAFGIDLDDVIFTSELDKPETLTREKRKTDFVYKFTTRGYSMTGSWYREKCDYNVGGFYVEFDSYKALIPKSLGFALTELDYYNLKKLLRVYPCEIVGVSKTKLKYLNSNWTNYFEYLDAQALELTNEVGAMVSIKNDDENYNWKNSLGFSKTGYSELKKFYDFCVLDSDLHSSNFYKLFMEIENEYTKVDEAKMEKLLTIQRVLSKTYTSTYKSSLTTNLDKLYSCYPIFESPIHVEYTPLEVLKQYVLMTDKNKGSDE